MKRLFVHTEHDAKITEWDRGEVFTLTFDPERDGWETDSGCEGYGLANEDGIRFKYVTQVMTDAKELENYVARRASQT